MIKNWKFMDARFSRFDENLAVPYWDWTSFGFGLSLNWLKGFRGIKFQLGFLDGHLGWYNS
jgi:hypothetical protein